MEEKVRLCYLYDFYGELFSEHQKSVFENYVLNDLSLSEVAEEEGMTRQGVFDLVKRCSAKLETYETKLGLLQKFLDIRGKAEEIRRLTDSERVQCLADEIIEAL